MMPVNLILEPELQALIPPLSEEEYRQLEQNILAEGCRDALIVSLVHYETLYCKGCYQEEPVHFGDGVWVCDRCGFGCAPDDMWLLDGYNRYKICQEHNIP